MEKAAEHFGNAENHSDSYKSLNENQKEAADTILGYLNGHNTRSVEVILLTLLQEIKYYSKIES